MKKFLSVFVALVLVFALCAMPASAETKPSEWKKGSGPVTIDFSDEGTKIGINEGVNLYYYQNLVDVRDFTVKLQFNSPVHDGEVCYYAITIGGNGNYTGTTSQNFLVMIYRGNHLCINPQVLHNGQSTIKPVSQNLVIDITKGDVLFHFKQVDELTYSVAVEEQGFYYEYSIPENFNWCTDMNGEGALGFGGRIGAAMADAYPENSFSVVVKEINGVKMNGKNDPVSSDTSTGNNDTTGDSNIDPDTGINTGLIGGDTTTDTTDVNTEESGISVLTLVLICGAAFVIVAEAIVIIILAIKLKKATAPVEEVEETEEAEETEETEE